MGRIRALVPVEVDPAIARTATIWTLRRWRFVLGSKALETRRCFDQGAVHTEVLVAQHVQSIGLEHYCVEELATDAVAQQPRAVLGKRAVIEAGLEEIHIQEPAKQQVVGQLLAESPLAPNGVQADQQAGFEQPFGWNGGTTLTVGGVHLIEQRRKLHQGSVGETFDGPQRMIARDQRLRVNERQHAGLLLGPSAHCDHLTPRWFNPIRPTHSTGRAGVHQSGRISPAC